MFRSILFLSFFIVNANSLAESFSNDVQTEYGLLSKCSQAEISVIMLIDVADVALYSGDCSQLPMLTKELQLSFIYHRKIAAEDFISAADTLLKRNLSATEFEQIKQDLEEFNAAYESVKEGDRYDIRRNQSGLSLFKNNRLLSHHPSITLAQYYYQIWFGDTPFDDKLKQSLLNPSS